MRLSVLKSTLVRGALGLALGALSMAASAGFVLLPNAGSVLPGGTFNANNGTVAFIGSNVTRTLTATVPTQFYNTYSFAHPVALRVTCCQQCLAGASTDPAGFDISVSPCTRYLGQTRDAVRETTLFAFAADPASGNPPDHGGADLWAHDHPTPAARWAA